MGYSYFGAHGKLQPAGISYSSINVGAIGSFAYYFNNHLGLEGQYVNHVVNSSTPSDGAVGISGGPIYRVSSLNNVTFFAHGLFGAEQVTGPDSNYPPASVSNEPGRWGYGFTAGGGMDLDLPFYDHRFSIRVVEADYRFSHVDFGTYNGLPTAAPAALGGHTNLSAAEVSTGIVTHFGHIAPPPAVTYSCSLSPSLVFPGDPITVTGTAMNLNPNPNPKKVVSYTWTTDGGTISGTSNVANVNTATATPGTYTVKGHVSQGVNPKPGQMADCSATFTVRAFEPPTISCSANPSSVNAGGISTIRSNASSPQNRPLTYSYNATAGSISSTTPSATLSTPQIAPGGANLAISVTCGVSDDKGHHVTATTSVNVIAPPPPPPPPAPQASSLCAVSFERDAKRPTRVDNEAKACLDDVALSLQRTSDAKLALVGNEDAKEKAAEEKEAARQAKRKHPEVKPSDAAERAVNTKDYLVSEKGIDASRILVYTGTDDGKTVTTTLIPAGAANPAMSDTPVDESAVKSVPRTAPVKPVKKAAAKPAAATK
ncbi:MAG: hypothetical protein ACLQM6_08065 [Acidobacteriaceae bacterium]